MDFTTPEDAVRGMLAAFAAARQRPPNPPAQTASGSEPSGLVELLRNTNVFPRELAGPDNAPASESSLYADPPALEEDGPSGSRVTPASRGRTSSTGGDDLESDDDDLPALEASPSSSSEDVSLRGLRTSVHRSDDEGTSGPSATHLNTLLERMRDRVRATTARELRASEAAVNPVSSPRQSGRASESIASDEAGADSDSSLPTLRTVSNSSSGESYAYSDSESDWGNTDDYYDDSEDPSESDDEDAFPQPNLRNQPAPAIRPSVPLVSMPPPSLPPNAEDTFQVYREVLDRARQIIPDFGQRLSEIAQHLHGGEGDPKRAEVLLAGMEVVPTDLVRRYERLRMGDKEDGDGCAICRDDLLDLSSEGLQATEIVGLYAALPFQPEINSIIAFPCPGKHLFHTECLSPWLARKTTCPSCRFDIDPHSLTLKRNREPLGSLYEQTDRPGRVWQPPQVESMSDWLDAEEHAQATGVPRQRPQVVMPDYGPPSISMSPLLTPAAHAAHAAHAALDGAPATRPTGPPTLSDLLDSPVPDWDYDPVTGNFDVGAALRDVEEMRQRFLNAEARRVELENILARTSLPPGDPAPQAPPRPPSAPPVPPSAASPNWLERAHDLEPPPMPRFLQAALGREGGLPGANAAAAGSLADIARGARATPHAQSFFNREPHPPASPVPEHHATMTEQRLVHIERELQNMQRHVQELRSRPEYAAIPTPFESVLGRLERSAGAARDDVSRRVAARHAELESLGLTPPSSRSAFVPTYARWPVLSSADDPPPVASPFIRFPVPPLPPSIPSNNQPTEVANAFDGDEVPPPIQADPNQALQAVAPLVIDQEYMDALLSMSGLPPGAAANAPHAQGYNPGDLDAEDVD
ncbi:hypothetical protein FKP32DRAFT_1680903 [Trametes sanguinea]|nr:hypothetical protein FKP32DRAFT_1680903 [Trametes sanguinea]